MNLGSKIRPRYSNWETSWIVYELGRRLERVNTREMWSCLVFCRPPRYHINVLSFFLERRVEKT